MKTAYLWGAYLKSRIKVIAAFVLFMLVFALVYTLNHLPLEPVVYSAELVTALAVIFAGLDWLQFYQKHQRLTAAINAATAVLLRTRAFEILQNPAANPKDVSNLVKLLISAKKQDLDRQNLALDKDKFELLRRKADRLDELENKAKKMRADGGVSPETLDVLEKQLRLM